MRIILFFISVSIWLSFSAAYAQVEEVYYLENDEIKAISSYSKKLKKKKGALVQINEEDQQKIRSIFYLADSIKQDDDLVYAKFDRDELNRLQQVILDLEQVNSKQISQVTLQDINSNKLMDYYLFIDEQKGNKLDTNEQIISCRNMYRQKTYERIEGQTLNQFFDFDNIESDLEIGIPEMESFKKETSYLSTRLIMNDTTLKFSGYSFSEVNDFYNNLFSNKDIDDAKCADCKLVVSLRMLDVNPVQKFANQKSVSQKIDFEEGTNDEENRESVLINNNKSIEQNDKPLASSTEDTSALSTTIVNTNTLDSIVFNVLFGFDSDDVVGQEERLIQIIKDIDKKNTEIVLIGHTDQQGNAPYNLNLSKRRALSVQKYLVNAGVDREMIEVLYKGEMEPRHAERNPDGTPNYQGMKLNRRVQMIIIQ